MSDKIIIDTSAFYALASANDKFHSKAKVIYERLIDQKFELYTSSYIFVEAAALIQHRLGFQALRIFVDSVRESFHFLWIDRHTHWQAWEILKEQYSREISFVDLTTVLLAKSLDARVFAFDEDFRQEGIFLIDK
jgi:predicted nucleic acid-binding protein